MITLIICDDHPVIRTGLRALFSAATDMTVLAEAATPDEAVVLAERLEPDVVVMDLQFNAEGTLETGAHGTARLRALPRPPLVLILTNYDTDADILGTIEAGASGYLLKDTPPDTLLDGIRSAAKGESALAPGISSRLAGHRSGTGLGLSAREMEVLILVARGRTNSQIADALFLTESTVKSHLVHIFTKLGVSSRTSAVAHARSHGLIRD